MNFLDKLSQYRIAKNTSVLAVTQLASRVAAIVYVTALARYVGAGGIGQLSTANSINSILLLIVGPGLSVLFVRDVASKPERAASYVANTLFIRLLLFIPFVLATFLVGNSGRYPADTVNIVHLYTVIYLFDSLTEILICVFRSYEHMEYEGGLQIARDGTNIVLSLLAIYLHWSLYAIVFMSVIAQVVKLLLALRLVSKHLVLPELHLDLSVSKSLLLTSLPFGFLLIIQTLEAELGTFVLSLYYDASVVGVFAAANTLIIMLLLIPNSFSNAIFPNISRMYHRSMSELREFYRLSFKYLLILGFPLGLGTMLVGQRAILLIYGELVQRLGAAGCDHGGLPLYHCRLQQRPGASGDWTPALLRLDGGCGRDRAGHTLLLARADHGSHWRGAGVYAWRRHGDIFRAFLRLPSSVASVRPLVNPGARLAGDGGDGRGGGLGFAGGNLVAAGLAGDRSAGLWSGADCAARPEARRASDSGRSVAKG